MVKEFVCNPDMARRMKELLARPMPTTSAEVEEIFRLAGELQDEYSELTEVSGVPQVHCDLYNQFRHLISPSMIAARACLE